MTDQNGWHECIAENWPVFIKLIEEITKPRIGEQHRFLYRGQIDKCWDLIPSFSRYIQPPIDLTIDRIFQIEQDLKKEFESQAHLHLDPALLPQKKDWLGWWSLMQHYSAPTRLLDWTVSPYVAAYFAVDSGVETDGLIWVINDWALGDRMKEQSPSDWKLWKTQVRPVNDWERIARYFNSRCRLFSDIPNSQICFFQPEKRSHRVVAQQGWLSFYLSPLTDYQQTIGRLFNEHRQTHHPPVEKDASAWKYWNCKILIPKEQKKEFLRQLQLMNITANALFPGVDGLGRSLKEFVQIEVANSKPGSSHPL